MSDSLVCLSQRGTSAPLPIARVFKEATFCFDPELAFTAIKGEEIDSTELAPRSRGLESLVHHEHAGTGLCLPGCADEGLNKHFQLTVQQEGAPLEGK